MNSQKPILATENRSLVFFLTARVLIGFVVQMFTIVVGYQMYEITKATFGVSKSAYYLGLIGLVQFLPMVLLTLVVGYVADKFDLRKIVCICQIVQLTGALALAVGSFKGIVTKESILIIVFIIGASNAFQGPAMQAMLPNIVSKEMFPRAAAWAASAFQTAIILGPALGGLLYILGAGTVYTVVVALSLISSILILFVSVSRKLEGKEPVSMKTIFGGISFIKTHPIVLGAISLDLFAVLFGGATALLPIYANTILNVGSVGLGLLRSAPAVGALILSFYLARKPLKGKVGYKMFTAVAVFGVCTILFAISKNFILSMIILVIMGAADVISVVVRSTLVQLNTPDNMRGRVSSVNSLFIGTSNQLGEFESGVTSRIFGGVVPAVIVGGIGTLVVVALWMKFFPALLHTDQLRKEG